MALYSISRNETPRKIGCQYANVRYIWRHPIVFMYVIETSKTRLKTRCTRFYLFSLIREQSFNLMLKSQDGYMQILE